MSRTLDFSVKFVCDFCNHKSSIDRVNLMYEGHDDSCPKCGHSSLTQKLYKPFTYYVYYADGIKDFDRLQDAFHFFYECHPYETDFFKGKSTRYKSLGLSATDYASAVDLVRTESVYDVIEMEVKESKVCQWSDDCLKSDLWNNPIIYRNIKRQILEIQELFEYYTTSC